MDKSTLSPSNPDSLSKLEVAMHTLPVAYEITKEQGFGEHKPLIAENAFELAEALIEEADRHDTHVEKP